MMNDKIKEQIAAAVTAALAPLTEKIAKLEADFAPLLAKVAKANKLQNNIKEAQALFMQIPDETKKALGIVNVGFDPHKVWFQIIRENGQNISVKKQEFDFRIRVRDEAGKLVKEANPSLNGYPACIAALVETV